MCCFVLYLDGSIEYDMLIVINSDGNVTALLSSGQTLPFCLGVFLQHGMLLNSRWKHGCVVSISVSLSFSSPSIPSALILNIMVMTAVRGLGCLKGRQLPPILSITEC